jgi:hypothetical protein
VRYEWSRILRIVLLAAAIYAVDTIRPVQSVVPDVIVKIILLLLFLLSLRVSGFFSSAETSALRSLMRRSPRR